MKILGIHTQSHDTSVALVKNGTILYAAANERFSRKKLDCDPPVEVLEDCLRYTKIKPQEIDRVVFVGDPFPHSYFGRVKELSWPLVKSHGSNIKQWRSLYQKLRELAIATGIPSYLYREAWSKHIIRSKLSGYKESFDYVHHHDAHLYSAYYTSGWKNCLVSCIEGSGFDETTSVYHVQNNKWTQIVKQHLPDSAGKFYELVTLLLGFNVLRHPGKITGLAAYGNPNKFYKHVEDLLYVEGLEVKLNYQKYLEWRIPYESSGKVPKEVVRFSREDIAAAFQKRLEDCISESIHKCATITGENKIALAGGVVANVKLNQRIHELSSIHSVYIHPAMGDSGLALGACLYTAHKTGKKIKYLQSVFLGPDYSSREILKSIKRYSLRYTKEKNIEKKIAQLLIKGNVIARFNGRMEYGPRALGNRSVLYHAKDKSVNDWLNKQLNRTEFMPFAPVTLNHKAGECYKNIKGAEYAARFMTITFNVTEKMKKQSPAVVHVDGTARPQLIRKKDNPSYYKILYEYYKLTAIPTLVNTSFNMHEEPIVCSPDEAVRSFLSGGLDYLAIGDYLVVRNES